MRSTTRTAAFCRRSLRAAVYLRDKMTCVYCGTPVVRVAKWQPDMATLDHWVPVVHWAAWVDFMRAMETATSQGREEGVGVHLLTSLALREKRDGDAPRAGHAHCAGASARCHCMHVLRPVAVHHHTNLVTACAACNSALSDTVPWPHMGAVLRHPVSPALSEAAWVLGAPVFLPPNPTDTGTVYATVRVAEPDVSDGQCTQRCYDADHFRAGCAYHQSEHVRSAIKFRSLRRLQQPVDRELALELSKQWWPGKRTH